MRARARATEGQLPAVVAGWQRTPTAEAGFFYRVPGAAVVSVGADERRLEPLLGAAC